VERPTKPGNAAVLAAAYAKLANECARAREFCAAKLESPLRDCVYRTRAILGRVNRLLESAYAPEIAASIVALNKLAAETAQRAEAARTPEPFDKARSMMLEMRQLFAGFNAGADLNRQAESRAGLANNSAADTQNNSYAPRVSVVIPAYNSAGAVWRAIESGLAQQLEDALEIIVVDDCSTDETREVLKLYDRRIRTVAMRSNRGVAAVRNAGMAVARGEYVAFLDAHDEFLPGRLARSVAALDGARDTVLAYSDACLCDDAGLVTAPSLAPTIVAPSTMRSPSLDDLFSGSWWPILPSAVTVRREVMERCGGFDEALGGAGGHLELYAWLRVRELGPFAFIAAPLVQWRLLPALERLEKYLSNLNVLYQLMNQRYGERGARMVQDFAISNAMALIHEGSSALSRKDRATGRRALACALSHLGDSIFGDSISAEKGRACDRVSSVADTAAAVAS
jgi:hypothetical protein